jgi:hypothetical protein
MWAASLLFPLDAPIKVLYTLFGFMGQCPHTGLLFSCHITNMFLIFRAAAGRKIWAYRLCNGRPLGTGAWLVFVFFVLTCVIFVTVRIHDKF